MNIPLSAAYDQCSYKAEEIQRKVEATLKEEAKKVADVRREYLDATLMAGQLVDWGNELFENEFRQCYENSPRLQHMVNVIVGRTTYYFRTNFSNSQVLENILQGKEPSTM